VLIESFLQRLFGTGGVKRAMEPSAIQEQLARSFLDHRLSRNERQALAESLQHVSPGPEADAIRRHAFDLVRDALKGHAEAAPMMEWLEDVIKHLPGSSLSGNQQPFAEAHFSPGDDCPRAISHRLASVRETLELCLFTITDDRLSNQVLDAHQRGVRVRIITDNDKAGDLGSDVERLRGVGIPVREDRSPFHMHHKFALFDRSTLITGSYNWTRGAARDNQENIIVTNDRGLVGAFGSTFERLWQSLA
jgi:phosphatidylserine/phosphatidylglycerophosphate/cardiolipin synthase-like enzyme